MKQKSRGMQSTTIKKQKTKLRKQERVRKLEKEKSEADITSKSREARREQKSNEVEKGKAKSRRKKNRKKKMQKKQTKPDLLQPTEIVKWSQRTSSLRLTCSLDRYKPCAKTNFWWTKT